MVPGAYGGELPAAAVVQAKRTHRATLTADATGLPATGDVDVFAGALGRRGRWWDSDFGPRCAVPVLAQGVVRRALIRLVLAAHGPEVADRTLDIDQEVSTGMCRRRRLRLGPCQSVPVLDERHVRR